MEQQSPCVTITEPMYCSYRKACASRACALQQEKPQTVRRRPCTAMKSSPHSPQLEEVCVHQSPQAPLPGNERPSNLVYRLLEKKPGFSVIKAVADCAQSSLILFVKVSEEWIFHNPSQHCPPVSLNRIRSCPLGKGLNLHL